MMNSFFGRKLGQTQMFTVSGKRIPVTHVDVSAVNITAITSFPNYQAIELGFGIRKLLTKAMQGKVTKAGLTTKPRFFRTVRIENGTVLKLGQAIEASEVFAVGDKVTITGTSKGKGFAGVVKRHGFAGGPRTHGQSDRERAPGSIGQTTTPGRVYLGKRMAGHMGQETVTLKGLQVIAIDTEKKIMTVKGLIPGGKNGVIRIVKQV
ncbi:50S ribosomal protein L3 [Candidatus Gottesmanbacteria bacterium]|nr:50S ribosomal protein L3 [Candidatus Gottesmanbacteria bacterium]